MPNPFDQFDSKPQSSGNPFDQFDAPKEKSFGQKAFEYVGAPVIETVGAIGGGLAGTELGPPGMIAGAGLGYGIGKGLVQEAGQRLGYYKPETPKEALTRTGQDILAGGTMEAGGQLLGPVLKWGGSKLGALAGKASDYFGGRSGEIKAGKIAREALGNDLPAARQALSQAADDVSASQALATINPATKQAELTLPTAQALLKRAEARDPEFFTKMFGKQEAARYKELEQIALGGNQTAARQAQEELKKQLNERLIPVLKTEINAANQAGKLKYKFAGFAQKMEEGAARKVQDVRQMTAAGERALDRANKNYPVSGMPRTPGRYTYMADLAKRAEDVVTQAAEGSLRFGDAARFARYQEESLAAHGLKPLESQPLVDAILRETKNPQIAGNRELEIGLNRIANDIKKWTDNNGIIDAWALDSIRKNSINSVARQLYQNDAKAQRIFAGKVIESTKPLIIKAVEESGGSGYGQYLKDYMAGMESIAQNKLGAKAMELYKNNPTAFVRFVEGNEPEIVEGVLGQGKYNVFKDLAESTRQRLENVSSQLVREKAIGEQAKEGTTRLQEILKKESSMFSRFPHILNRKAVIANTALEELENHVNKKTWHALTEASKSAKSFNDLISQLPASEKSDFLKAWKQVNPESFKKFAVGVQVPFQNDNRNDPLNLNMQVKLPGE